MKEIKRLVEHILVSNYLFEDETSKAGMVKNKLRKALIYHKIVKSKALDIVEKFDAIMQVHSSGSPKGVSMNATYQLESFLNRI